MSNEASGESALAGVTEDGRLVFAKIELEESLSGDVSTELRYAALPPIGGEVRHLAVSGDQRWVFAADDFGQLALISVARLDAPLVVDSVSVTRPGERVTVVRKLLGGISLLIGTSRVRGCAVDNEHPDVSFSSLWGKVW